MYNRFNFYKSTFAIFRKTQQPEGFTKANFTSKHGSKYVFTTEGVYRCSNHWGRVGNCRWRLEGIDYKQQNFYWGFAKWEHFYDNNETLPLFFIEKVGDEQYSYNHKQNNINEKNALRSGADTAKTLKKINEIVSGNAWAKYLVYDDYNALKEYFIEQLITTTQNFNQIKQAYIASKKEL